MAAYNKFNNFIKDCIQKKHNIGSDQIKIFLTNTAPVATNGVLADITEVGYTHCSSRDVTTTVTSSGASHVVAFTDMTLTASGGSVGPFRYVGLYNDTATNKELIGWYDYGSSITLADGEKLEIDFADASLTFS